MGPAVAAVAIGLVVEQVVQLAPSAQLVALELEPEPELEQLVVAVVVAAAADRQPLVPALVLVLVPLVALFVDVAIWSPWRVEAESAVPRVMIVLDRIGRTDWNAEVGGFAGWRGCWGWYRY